MGLLNELKKEAQEAWIPNVERNSYFIGIMSTKLLYIKSTRN